MTEVLDVSDFLDHHGIKGQKWGIRTDRTSGHSSKESSSIQIDESPWSNYKESDYTPQQWHKACLIHDHGPGEVSTKNKCKLPIRTPDGVVNRHGVYSAAAALAGARGGVKASSKQKASAHRELVTIYAKMDAKPPASLVGHSSIKGGDMNVGGFVDDFLEHHGVKGMKWGVINKSRSKSSKTTQTQYHKTPNRLDDAELNRRIKRMELEKRYNDLNQPKKSQGKKYVHELLQNNGKAITTAIVSTATAFLVRRALEKKFPPILKR